MAAADQLVFDKIVASWKPLEIESLFLAPRADFRIWNSSCLRVALDFLSGIQYGHLAPENVIGIHRRLTLNCLHFVSSQLATTGVPGMPSHFS